MKKYILALLAVSIFAACEHHDLVVGSIPPKMAEVTPNTTGPKVEIVENDLSQIIIYFEDSINPATLQANTINNVIKVDVYNDDGYSGTINADQFFDTSIHSYPWLNKSIVDNDVLILPLKKKPNNDPIMDAGKTYVITLNYYQLDCIIGSKDCTQRDYPFFISLLASASIDNEHPPYIISTVPPDEESFTGASLPLFPPHGSIQVSFSEPVGYLSIAATGESSPLNATDWAAPSDLKFYHYYWGDCWWEEFDNTQHTDFCANTHMGWPINQRVSLIMVSKPSNLDSIIDGCINTSTCTRPPLSNILLYPSADNTGAPILFPEGDYLYDWLFAVDDEHGFTVGIVQGYYKTPCNWVNQGDDENPIWVWACDYTGFYTDNMDIGITFARVRIDYPPNHLNFNPEAYEQEQINGIYTNDPSTPNQNVTSIEILCGKVGYLGKIGNSLGFADMLGGEPIGHFRLVLPNGYDGLDETCGSSYALRAVATSGDGKAGFDFVEAWQQNEAVTVKITEPIETANNYYIHVEADVRDYYGIDWVKTCIVDGDECHEVASSICHPQSSDCWQEYDGWWYHVDYHSGIVSLPDGFNTIRVVAASIWGDIGYDEETIFVMKDEDNDGFQDDWEAKYCQSDPTVCNNPNADADNDDLKNKNESWYGTDPLNVDTDGDHVKDGWEINGCHLDFPDHTQYPYCTDPLNQDSDGDGLLDSEGLANVFATDPNHKDTDGDDMPDEWEVLHGLDPLVDDSAANDDADDLTNLEEYNAGTDPWNPDTDGDLKSDSFELSAACSGCDPLVRDEPVISYVHPAVGKEGDTLYIEGTRLGENPLVGTAVTINGIAASLIDCPNDSESEIICIMIPTGAKGGHSGITITSTYSTAEFHSISAFPIKVTDLSSIHETVELEPGPTPLLLQGGTVYAYGYIRPGDRDAYTFTIPDRSVLNISAYSFDAFDNHIIASGDHPDTYLNVIDSGGNIVSSNDDFGGSKNSSINELVLEKGDYTIEVTVPGVEAGNSDSGFYELSVDTLESPYITDVSPAIIPSETNTQLTISGCNFGSTGNNYIEISGLGTIYPVFKKESSSSITIEIQGDGSIGGNYSFVITNETTGLLSTNDEVDAHNEPAILGILDPLQYAKEHAIGSASLSDGRTAVGFVGPGRGKFKFFSISGEIVEAEMAFQNIGTGGPISGTPEVELIAPDGSIVPRFPGYPQTQHGNTALERYALPSTGEYSFIAQGTPSTTPSYYKLSYSYKDAPEVNQIQLLTTDYPLYPIVQGATTTITNLKVKVLKGSAPIANTAVIFKTTDKEYLSFTGSDGTAMAPPIRTKKSPIQSRIIAYPAGFRSIKAKFNYALIPAYSNEDWDGDGVTNEQEINDGTSTQDIDSDYNGKMDGFTPNPTANDTDGDGLSNQWEYYYGCKPSGTKSYDSDGDIYPDSVDINHCAPEGSADPVDIKWVPLDFNPGLGEQILIFAIAKDRSGHLRKNINVNVNSTYPDDENPYPPSRPTDGRGLAWFLLGNAATADSGKLYYTNGKYPTLGTHQRLTINANPCSTSKPCISASDNMDILAIPQKADPIMKVSPETGPFDAWTGRISEGNQLQVKVYELQGTTKVPNPNQWVMFTVRTPSQTIPGPRPDFKNAALSKEWTPDWADHYPNNCLYLGCDLDDQFVSLPVLTDQDGIAKVNFYSGNASNFTYHISAIVDQGATVGFDIQTAGQPINHWTSMHHEIEKAIKGTTVPLDINGIGFRGLSNPCGPLDPCVYDVYPLSGATARFEIVYYPSTWEAVPGVFTAGPNGRISAQLTLENRYFPNPEQPYVDVQSAINGSPNFGWDYTIEGVNRSDIKLKMQRLTASGDTVNLANGGTVYSSFKRATAKDKSVLVIIENLPSYPLDLFLHEQPGSTASRVDMLIAPPGPSHGSTISSYRRVFERQPNDVYNYRLYQYAARGKFIFELFDYSAQISPLDSSSAFIKNDYLDYNCVRSRDELTPPGYTGTCTGRVEWIAADGTTTTGGFDARSGEMHWYDPEFRPALPSYNYTFKEVIPRDDNPAMCDSEGICWFAPFLETPCDSNSLPNSSECNNNGRIRRGLGLHPIHQTTTREPLTHGCIGNWPNGDTSSLRDLLRRYVRYYGDMVIIVH